MRSFRLGIALVVCLMVAGCISSTRPASLPPPSTPEAVVGRDKLAAVPQPTVKPSINELLKSSK